ncbi:hypothetical protein [Micromonospora phaseoli]|uniref:hypothetical protein n=1 Tax=Micromonospora phaseoli TaxID=1144548 RepID=UPI000B8784D4|nr:hypothetical protein [Micromonospora phaseoli]
MIESSPPRRAERASGTSSPVTLLARGIALVVVLPVRLVWEALVATGRGLSRWVFAPTMRFLDRWLLRPFGWLLRHLLWIPLRWSLRAAGWLWQTLVWLPLTWAWRNLVWSPLTWLWRSLVRLWRGTLWPPLRWCGQLLGRLLRGCGLALAWLLRVMVLVPLYYLLWVPLVWLVRVLTPAGRLVGRGLATLAGLVVVVLGWAWRAAGRVLWWCWALTGRPMLWAGRWVWRHAVVPAGRAVGAAWRATVSPAARWLRRGVLDPARQATREALSVLGVRR